MKYLIYLAILPSIILGWYIYKNDKVEKESGALLTKLFFGGIGSIVVTLLLSYFSQWLFPILNSENSTNLIDLFLAVFIGIALIEEFSKWIFLKLITWKNKEFTHIYDALVYGVFVSLGFATLENILYVLVGGVLVALGRAVLSVPLHVFCGVFMGYYYGLAKQCTINNKDGLAKKNLFFSLLVPTLLHGFFDYCLMAGNVFLFLAFFIFVILVYIFAFRTVARMSKISRSLNPNVVITNTQNSIQNNINVTQNNLVNEKKFCSNCGKTCNTTYCTYCGNKN